MNLEPDWHLTGRPPLMISYPLPPRRGRAGAAEMSALPTISACANPTGVISLMLGHKAGMATMIRIEPTSCPCCDTYLG
jgi:hypothetical protein